MKSDKELSTREIQKTPVEDVNAVVLQKVKDLVNSHDLSTSQQLHVKLFALLNS